MIYIVKSSTEIKHAQKLDICPLSKAASISVTTLRTAVSVEKTADKWIKQKAAIHCH